MYHRNIFGSSSIVFGNLWTSSEIFGNSRKMSGNVRLAFRTILENLRKSSESGRKARTISHSFAAFTHEILFLPLKHKIHIFSPPCNILYLLRRFLNLCFKLKISISSEVIVTLSISWVIPKEGPSFQFIDSLASLLNNHLSVCLNSKSATERKFNTEALRPPTAFHKWYIFFITLTF